MATNSDPVEARAFIARAWRRPWKVTHTEIARLVKLGVWYRQQSGFVNETLAMWWIMVFVIFFGQLALVFGLVVGANL